MAIEPKCDRLALDGMATWPGRLLGVPQSAEGDATKKDWASLAHRAAAA